MTKKQALRDFKEHVLPNIPLRHNGKVDEVARSEAWNNYTDALCKDGQITLKQYESWTNPF